MDGGWAPTMYDENNGEIPIKMDDLGTTIQNFSPRRSFKVRWIAFYDDAAAVLPVHGPWMPGEVEQEIGWDGMAMGFLGKL